MEAPMALVPSRLASARATSVWRRHTSKGKLLGRGPTLSIKLAVLSIRQSEAVNKLPKEMFCPAALVPILATYRELAAEAAAATGHALYGNTCNPTLRVLPSLLADPAIAQEMMEVWRRMAARWTPGQAREPARRREVLQGLTMKFWPLLHANAVPAMHVAGNIEASRQRMRVIKGYTEDHPVGCKI
jgi:hypothetical protein